MMTMVEVCAWYVLAIAVGSVAAEFAHIVMNQELYNHGQTVRQQINRWWRTRYDNLGASLFFGAIGGFLLHQIRFGELVSYILKQYVGFDYDGLTISSFAGAGVIALLTNVGIARYKKKHGNES